MNRPTLGVLAVAASFFATSCSVFQPGLSTTKGRLYSKDTAPRAIPVTPGVPDLGQQPLIPQDPSIVGAKVPMTLLYTSDIHSRVDAFADGYYHHTYAGKGGMARIATKVRDLRRTEPNTLVLDSGDYLQGTPFFNFFKGEVEMKAMSLIGFDAVTIGNHEFDNGIGDLRKALTFYSGKPITTNVTFEPEIAARYAVVKAGPLRVGVFGLLTDVNGLIAPPNFKEARYYDPIEVARATVAKLEKECDVIVCISHVGSVPPWSDESISDDDHDEVPDDAQEAVITDETIAQKAPGIDIILSGHTHLMIKKPKLIQSGASRTLIVSPGFGGGYLGKFGANIKDGAIVEAKNDLISIDKTVAVDPAVEAAIAPFRQRLDQVVKQPIGVANGDFRRYSGKDYESGLNNLIADGTLAAARKIDPTVSFAMVSSGTPRNHIVRGTIKVEDAYFALPFDNKIVIATVKGDVANEMLRIQRRPKERKRHAISNATYVLNPTTMAISDIQIAGKPLDPAATYNVAVNDYMAEGGGGFTMLPGQKRLDTGVLQREALMALIKETGTITPQVGRIRLKAAVSP